jgi:imidazolonepropionase-like amidohydrolase
MAREPDCEYSFTMRARYLGTALLLLASWKPLAGQTDGALIIRGGSWLDVRAGRLRPNGAIVIRDGKITSLVPPRRDWRPPDHADVIDADGRTILPGLIDAHVHLTLAGDPDSNAHATLLAGFTTVADLGSADGAGIRLRDEVAQGRAIGPTIIAAGSWIGTRGGVCEFGGATVDDAEGARARTRADIAAGADLIKVCVTGWPKDAVTHPDSVELKAPLLDAVVTIARAGHRPVFAHAIGQAGALLAASHGVRALAHTPIVDSAAAAALARSGITVISTLASLGSRPGGEEVRQSMRRLHAAGVPIVAGTDAGVLAHGQNARELVALTEAGFTPADALRAATVGAAALLRTPSIGEIKAGGAADLVLVQGDPLKDIHVMQNPVLVLKRGRAVR